MGQAGRKVPQLLQRALFIKNKKSDQIIEPDEKISLNKSIKENSDSLVR